MLIRRYVMTLRVEVRKAVRFSAAGRVFGWGLLGLVLWAGCAQDTGEVSNGVQGVAMALDGQAGIPALAQAQAASCTLRRPVGWSGRGVSCLEKLTGTLTLVHGQVYHAVSGVSCPSCGVGYIDLQCNDGRLITLAQRCTRDGGGGGGVIP